MADKRASPYRDLGLRFRELRQARKWTQLRLSAAACVSRDTIHRLERGEAVDVSSLFRLVDAMGYRITFEPKPALPAADMRRLFPEVHEDDRV